jgi:ribosomal protein L21E
MSEPSASDHRSRNHMNYLAPIRIALSALFAATSTVRAGDTLDCHIGSYQLADGNVVDIAPSVDDTQRWRQFDGTTGALHKTGNGGYDDVQLTTRLRAGPVGRPAGGDAHE